MTGVQSEGIVGRFKMIEFQSKESSRAKWSSIGPLFEGSSVTELQWALTRRKCHCAKVTEWANAIWQAVTAGVSECATNSGDRSRSDAL